MDEGALLAQARVLKDKHDALAAATGESFNLFALLNRERDEVRTHSALLAELLDPNGSHLQGPVFARLFIGRFGERVGLAGMPIDDARVWRERSIDSKSRADIVIETEDARIVIENKIGADDQLRQIERYQAYAKDRERWAVLYLTLHGDLPSEKSLGKLAGDKLARDKIACLSYEQDVLAWLDDCVKEVARVPHIREILAHYQGLLRKLTGKATRGLTMEIRKLLADQHGGKYNFELAPAIAEAMTELSTETEWKFWQAVKRQLLDAGDRAWRLTPAPRIGDASNPLKEVTAGAIKHAHGTGRHKWFYGWTFHIVSEAARDRYRSDGAEIFLRVECDDWGWGRYGLIAATQMQEGVYRLARSGNAAQLFEDWAQRMSALKTGWRTEDEWWLAWTYPTVDTPLQKTTPPWLAPEVIRAFMEREGDEPLVEDIRHAIDAIEARGNDIE